MPNCATGPIEIISINEENLGKSYTVSGCIYRSKDYSLAWYTDEQNYQRWGFKLNSGDTYKTVENIDVYTKIALASESNDIAISMYPKYYLYTARDARSIITSGVAYQGNYSLQIDLGTSNQWFERVQDGIKGYSSVTHFAISQNGKYLLAWIDYAGLAKIDLSTDTARAVMRLEGAWYGGYVYNSYPVAITNDGTVGFLSSGPTLVLMSEPCGYTLDKAMLERGDVFTSVMPQCETYSFNERVNQLTGFNGYSSYFQWVGKEEGIEFLRQTWPYINDPKQVMVIIKKPDVPNSKLDYLAIGDSYSSGEGDLGKLADGTSFYIPGTEGAKGCHISIRSYPFILAARNSVPADRMQSVACSGARIAKDYYESSESYYGQGDRLKGKSDTELTSARSSARDEFTPGILKQIDFVKENKPKTITLTGGGNDVGFVNILKSCIFAYGPGEKAKTCDEAIPSTKKRMILGDAIRSQFTSTIKLIEALKQASDKTTIYVVGYPSFVSDSPSTCINSGTLNSAERATINESVAYLNEVLSAASKSAGANYIDTKDSLSGGRICEGSRYVTGMLNVLTNVEQMNNMFHPNAEGHIKLADAISAHNFTLEEDKNPLPVATPVPVKASVFGTGAYVPTTQEKLLTTDAAVEIGNTVGLTSPIGTILTAGDRVSFTLYSSPTNLGSYTVASNGAVSASIRIPKTVDPGMHMLVAEVASRGVVINRFYQYVEIGSGISGDKDGDGIKDSKDPCTFIDNWYDEETKQNICKVGAVSQPGSGSTNPGQGGSQSHLPKPQISDMLKHWKMAYIHYIFGMMVCVGIFGLRFR